MRGILSAKVVPWSSGDDDRQLLEASKAMLVKDRSWSSHWRD